MNEGQWLTTSIGEGIALSSELALPRCPHCQIDKPHLQRIAGPLITHDYRQQYERAWSVYVCSTCGGIVTASAAHHGGYISDYFPKVEQIDSEIPGNAREYLRQAIESIHAPAAAVLLAASAIDSMLKEKGYKEGHLKPRIDQAQKDNVITLEMAKWAHQVRLDANDPRHADEAKPLPNEEDARLSIEFAKALGTFMFTLPARVTRGIKDSEPK